MITVFSDVSERAVDSAALGAATSLAEASVVAVLVAGFTYALAFNRLRTSVNRVRNAWSDIDAELQRRYALIPQLVETVRASAVHERTLIEQLTTARSTGQSCAADRSAVARADATLSGLLSEVFVMAEGVPTLRTSADFLALQRELVTTEDRLAAARRYYNFKVRDLNILVGSAISGFIARRHQIDTAEYFGDAVPEVAPV